MLAWASLAEGEPLQHFVYFELERQRIHEPSFLETPAFAGAQLKYTWRELEPAPGVYDVQRIVDDFEFLHARGKKLFVQIQDVSFSRDIINVPDDLRSDPRYKGGANLKYEFEDEAETRPVVDGWVARRWDPTVRERFAKLLHALGARLDGKLEGINLAETSVGFGSKGPYHPEGFSFETYRDGVHAMMRAARDARTCCRTAKANRTTATA